MNFIEQLPLVFDLEKIIQEHDTFESKNPYPEKPFKINGKKIYAINQLGLKHRPNCICQTSDSSGSLINVQTKEILGYESDYTLYHDDIGIYTKEIISKLSDSIGQQFGRIRYMRLQPKTGLSVHVDTEERYHIVVKTNKFAYFGQSFEDELIKANCYHIPSDGHVYRIDTTKPHFVYNGGWEPRIHIVLNIIK